MPDDGIFRKLVIQNEFGLHLRPSGKFVTLANRFESRVFVSVDGREEVDGKSLLSLTTQAAPCGTPIRIRAVGADQVEALDALDRLVSSGFEDFESEGDGSSPCEGS